MPSSATHAFFSFLKVSKKNSLTCTAQMQHEFRELDCSFHCNVRKKPSPSLFLCCAYEYPVVYPGNEGSEFVVVFSKKALIMVAIFPLHNHGRQYPFWRF